MSRSVAEKLPGGAAVPVLREGRVSFRRRLGGLLESGDAVLGRLSTIMAACGVILMLVMLAATCLNIGLRPFGLGVRGIVEGSGYLCALAVGLCMPGAQRAGSHISVGLRTAALSPGMQYAQAALCGLGCFALLLIAGMELVEIAEYARDTGEYIEGFDVSYYGMAAGLAAGLAVHALVFLHGVLSLVCGGTGESS